MMTALIDAVGCPFTFKKSVGRSHPFGKNVTYGPINNSPEKCKRWCLVRSYCVAVDFSRSTSTCYFLREINDALLVSAPTVTHYEKTRCARESVKTHRRLSLLGEEAIASPSIGNTLWRV